MKKIHFNLFALVLMLQFGASSITHAGSSARSERIRFNVKLNAIQYAKKDKVYKIVQDLLKYEKASDDLGQVALLLISRPGTEERSRALLMKIYLKQHQLGQNKNQKDLGDKLIAAANTSGSSNTMTSALLNLGLTAYPKMIKALQCKKTRRRSKKSQAELPVNQVAMAKAISLLVKASPGAKPVKKSISRLLRCFKCANEGTALACGNAISFLKKLDNQSINSMRSILTSHKSKQRKIFAAQLLARNVVTDKRSRRALESGLRSRSELTRITSAVALYTKIRAHHGAKKALEKLGKSAKDDETRKQALQVLGEN